MKPPEKRLIVSDLMIIVCCVLLMILCEMWKRKQRREKSFTIFYFQAAELQENLQSSMREHARIRFYSFNYEELVTCHLLVVVRGQMGGCGREVRKSEITIEELQETDPSTLIYRPIGKMFARIDNEEMQTALVEEKGELGFD